MSIVTATIKSEGKTLSAQYELLSISVNREVNRIPSAALLLLDGDPAAQQFPLSEDSFFEPGNTIEIQLRYEGEGTGDTTIFKGLVVRHQLEATASHSTLSVELEDAALGMTKSRNSGVFQNETDGEIIKKLIKNGNLETGSMPELLPQYEEIVQYYCTDWDFMLSRAEANNLLVIVEDGKISLKKPETPEFAKYSFEYGISNLYSFEMEADASHQYQSIESVSWDIKTQELTQKTKATDFSLSQSNLNPKSIAAKFSGDNQLLASIVSLDASEAKAWADATMTRTRMAFLRGVISVPGFANPQLLEVMELSGFSKRFNGKTLITGVKHTVNENGWTTHLQFGLRADSFARAPHILDAPAAGLLPAVQGLQVGIVDTYEKDETQNEYRVRVILPGINEGNGKVWARMAYPDAGAGQEEKSRGFFFRPEKGDEVVLGFFNNDPRQPVILGSLYNSKNPPPANWGAQSETNSQKGIVSKTGISFVINDDEQTLSFSTSEQQSIVLDEKNKAITITDLNNNSITMNEQGLTIKVADKLCVEAEGDLELKGSNIKLEASSNVEIIGSQVNVK